MLYKSAVASRGRTAARAPVVSRKRNVCCAIPSVGIPNAFLAVDDEEKFMAALDTECKAGRIPAQLLPLWTDFFNNYKNAILSSGLPTHDIKLVAEVQASIADTVINQFANPYKFPSIHQSITEPYDYFEFGQKYVGSLINFKESYLGHRERFDRIQQQLENDENVILLANHQSEADPGIWAHMLMHTHPELARNVRFVAGDRVVSDPLCVPFSMGRNLFCVHSKRHMEDDPGSKPAKMAMNRRTLLGMGEAMAAGGCLLWIAPAGGRDRPGDDGVYVPAEFDPAAVELMRTLAAKAKKKAGRTTHLYPFAMYSAPLMPPPKTIEQGLGERRMVNFTGVGISVDKEMDADAVVAGLEGKEEIAAAFSNAVYSRVCELYKELDASVKDPSSAPAHFTQPWLHEAKVTGTEVAVGLEAAVPVAAAALAEAAAQVSAEAVAQVSAQVSAAAKVHKDDLPELANVKATDIAEVLAESKEDEDDMAGAIEGATWPTGKSAYFSTDEEEEEEEEVLAENRISKHPGPLVNRTWPGMISLDDDDEEVVESAAAEDSAK